MRKQNDFDLYKIEKTNPRIFKIKQLIKKSLGEIFLSHDYPLQCSDIYGVFLHEALLQQFPLVTDFGSAKSQ